MLDFKIQHFKLFSLNLKTDLFEILKKVIV